MFGYVFVKSLSFVIAIQRFVRYCGDGLYKSKPAGVGRHSSVCYHSFSFSSKSIIQSGFILCYSLDKVWYPQRQCICSRIYLIASDNFVLRLWQLSHFIKGRQLAQSCSSVIWPANSRTSTHTQTKTHTHTHTHTYTHSHTHTHRSLHTHSRGVCTNLHLTTNDLVWNGCFHE